MAKFRQMTSSVQRVTIMIMIVGTIIIVTFNYGIQRMSEASKDYSKSPQEVMAKFSVALHQSDTSRILSLCEGMNVYSQINSVPIESYSSRTSRIPLIRRQHQTAVQAWQRWFQQYGISYLRYRNSASQGGIVCMSQDESFAFGIKYVEEGYLITECSYSL